MLDEVFRQQFISSIQSTGDTESLTTKAIVKSSSHYTFNKRKYPHWNIPSSFSNEYIHYVNDPNSDLIRIDVHKEKYIGLYLNGKDVLIENNQKKKTIFFMKSQLNERLASLLNFYRNVCIRVRLDVELINYDFNETESITKASKGLNKFSDRIYLDESLYSSYIFQPTSEMETAYHHIIHHNPEAIFINTNETQFQSYHSLNPKNTTWKKIGKCTTQPNHQSTLFNQIQSQMTESDAFTQKHFNIDTLVASSQRLTLTSILCRMYKGKIEKPVSITSTDDEKDLGVYIQYTYARLSGIKRVNFGLFPLPKEIDVAILPSSTLDLIFKLTEYHQLLEDVVMRSWECGRLVSWCVEICKIVSSLSYEFRVKGEEDHVAKGRLVVLMKVREVIGDCLGVFGVDGVEFM